MNLPPDQTTYSSSLYEGLNPPQLEAVRHFEGPILVLAGAGSGKTRVLTRRVATLVLEQGIAPQHILAVTFTNKATEEMRERLQKLLGARAEELWVATFHSAALRMLRRHAQYLGYTNDFVVYDEHDSKNTLKAIIKEAGIDEKRYPVQYFSRMIDQAKNAYISADAFQGNGRFKHECIMQQEVYQAYQHALHKSNAMDFGDLLVNAVRLLEMPQLLELYRSQVQFILVDEYQDTNAVQYRFVRLMAAPRNNLLVVGDDDQSIYAFRGATIRNILEFEKDYTNTKVVKLEQNYRSTANILKASHAVIEKNKGRKSKKLWTTAPEGAPIWTYVAGDESDEASFVVREISSRARQGTNYKDIAIFYRTNAQSRALEEALVAQKIPYRIFGGLKFYDRKEIKDILAYLRLLVNESDDQAFMRTINTPPRGIGAQKLLLVGARAKKDGTALLSAAASLVAESDGPKEIEAYVALIAGLKEDSRKLALHDLLNAVIDRTEYAVKLEKLKDPASQSRIENLRELVALAQTLQTPAVEPFENLRQFLDRVALTAGSDGPVEQEAVAGEGKAQGTVSLMTLHLAKGLEFPLVFLTGAEEGLMPHYRSIEDPKAIEEERRLCYVGMTRAMRMLFLTRAVKRGMFSASDGFGLSGLYRDPSRFAFDIPPETLKHLSDEFTEGRAAVPNLDDDDIEFDDGESSKFRSKASSAPKTEHYRGPGAGMPRRSSISSGSFGISRADAIGAQGTTKKANTIPLPPGATPAQSADLNPGTTVLHSVFGEGVVEKLQISEPEDPSSLEVFVQFKNFEGSKKLVLKYAKLWVVK